MREIERIMTALGVTWCKGYMTCPKCGQTKLTASRHKDVATCWACHESWYPNKKHTYKVSWGIAIIRALAARAQNFLPECQPGLQWLQQRRKLEFDAGWFQNHHAGAWPHNLNPTRIIARAKKILEADHNRAAAMALDGDKDELEEDFKRERERLDMFITEKLEPLCRKQFWHDAVVFISTNAHGDPLSLKLRQYKAEEPGKKKEIYMVQPVLGRAGVFNPMQYCGEAWKQQVPTVIVEGEVNWLQLQAQTELWAQKKEKADYPTGFEWMAELDAQHYCLEGMAVGGKNGADLQTVCQLLNREAPVVFYDNDLIDLDTGKPGGYALVQCVNWKTPC